MSDDLITFHRNTAWTPILYTDGFPIVFTKITRAGLLLYLIKIINLLTSTS